MAHMRYTKGSFITVPNKEGLRGLKPQTQCVFMWLCHYANTSGKCFPSKKTLSKDCGMSERAVYNAVNELVKNRFVIEEKRVDKKTGQSKSNLYTVLLGGRVHEVQGEGAGGAGGRVHEVPTNSIHKNSIQLSSTASRAEKESDPLISEIIHLFEQINPACGKMYGHKAQREASASLLKVYGFEEVKKVVDILPKTNKIPYMPTINTPHQLWINYEKWKDKMIQKKTELKSKKVKVAF